jgi:2'-5' RNA ligase
VRLFVAVRPPAEAVEHLGAVLPRWPSDLRRWHVTLAFLGEVADPQPVTDALAGACREHRPFVLRLAGSGAFGRNGPVWVGLDGDLPELHALAESVADACRSAGVAVEDRPYRPHVTVGRRGSPDPRALADYAGPDWEVNQVELVRSRLGRAVRHEVLERVSL